MQRIGKLASIMGVEAGTKEKMVAFVACHAHGDDITYDYEYTGVEDCRMLGFVPNGGPKSCNYGCLGFGTCVSVCPFDAIHVDVSRMAYVSSAGLRVLLMMYKSLKDKERFEMTGVCSAVREILETTGFDQFLL